MDFIETMLIKDGKIVNLKYHLQRMKKTAKYFKWKNYKFQIPSSKFQARNCKECRIRVTYNEKGINNIEYFPVKERNFKKFKLIEIDFTYSFKYKNRQLFSNLYSHFSTFDEFILIKNHLVTDTTISNLAFFTGNEWLTPKFPLLKGTKRTELIEKKLLKEENIHISDLKYFKKIAMINAILGFKEINDFDIIR